LIADQTAGGVNTELALHQIKHDYKIEKGCISLEHEQPLIAAFQRGLSKLQSYSPEVQDWLSCQTLLNRLVAMLVNGDSAFSRKRPIDWVYRFLYPKPELWSGASQLSLSGSYTRRLQKYLTGKRVTVNSLYAALKEAEDFLLEPPAGVLTETQHCIVPEQPARQTIHPVVHEMRKMLLPLSDYISVYVHGSMATGDYTPFSDVDDLVILHQSSWESHKRFRQVAWLLEKTTTRFQRVDPLQHHGHWVFLDFDFACLDQSTMPLVVLKSAVRVVGRSEIEAEIRNHPWGFGRVLWAIIQEVRRDTLSLLRGTLNLYGLKNLVAGISILPPLTFQVHGRIIDKKTAILSSATIFSEQTFPALGWATKIREEWHSCPGYHWVERQKRLNPLLPARRRILEAIARNHSPRIELRQVPFLDEQTILAILKLTDEATEHLHRKLIL